MLQAMSTGHDGSMTTVHANNPKEAVGRLETLCMMAGMDLPARAIREQIANAVNVIVQIQRLSDGSRKIIDITEVQGLSGEVVTQQQVFVFKETGFDKNRRIVGQFQSTGLMPKFIEKFSRKGIIIPKNMFSNDPPPVAAAASGSTSSTTPTPNPGSPTGAQNPATPIKKAVGGGGR
jgi:pilus assembly protein CpaF